MVNVLITSASRKVNLIQMFKQAARKYNGKIIAADINRNSPALFFADDYEIIPQSEDKNFIPYLIKLCIKRDIKLIIPTRDEELAIFAKNKGKFLKENIHVMVADLNTIEICQNKDKFHRFCEENGISVPKRYSINDAKKNYPVFLKPFFGKASKNTFKINNDSEMRKILSNHGNNFLIEEFLDCKEYTIDLFSDFNNNVISIIPRERITVIAGESKVTRTVKDVNIMNLVKQLAEKLHLIGHNTIQCFKCKDNSIKFIEVNPRYGGAAHLGFKAGAFTPEFIMKLVQDEKITPMIGKFKDKLVMLRYSQDIFLDQNHQIYR